MCLHARLNPQIFNVREHQYHLHVDSLQSYSLAESHRKYWKTTTPAQMNFPGTCAGSQMNSGCRTCIQFGGVVGHRVLGRHPPRCWVTRRPLDHAEILARGLLLVIQAAGPRVPSNCHNGGRIQGHGHRSLEALVRVELLDQAMYSNPALYGIASGLAPQEMVQMNSDLVGSLRE